MGEPTAKWVFQGLGPAVFAAMVVYFAVETYRRRRLSFGAVLLVAFTAIWWQEWYGDWGSYILYNPKFALIPWGTTKWTTPNKPWAVIAAYGWFYPTIYLLAIAVVRRVRAAWPEIPKWVAILLVTAPLLYAWDLFVEGAASRLGWWSYTDFVGPALTGAKGNFPLLYPILLNPLFAFVTTTVLLWRDDKDRPQVEVRSGVTRARSGWRQDVARVAVWAVTANVLYFVTLVGPIVVIRELFGHANELVP